jgi:rhodanese-related sulfurtransferase
MAEEDANGELTPQELKEKLDAGAIQLIDVRTAAERESGGIPGSVHIDFDQLTEAAQTIDREKPVVLYCGSGNRSGVAAEAFRISGYDAYSLAGGIKAWLEAGLEVE